MRPLVHQVSINLAEFAPAGVHQSLPAKGNKTYRTEVLDCYVFDSLQQVRDMTADWLHRYNHHRPHEALGGIPSIKYRVKQFPNLYF